MHDPIKPRPLKPRTLQVLVADSNAFSRGLIGEILRSLNVTNISSARSEEMAANFLIDAESNLKAAISGFSSAPAAAPAKAEMPSTTSPGTPKGAGHQGEGTVDSVDAKAGTISLSHGPVPSLKWPAMTMEFKAANASLLQGLKPGAKIAIEFIERQPRSVGFGESFNPDHAVHRHRPPSRTCGRQELRRRVAWLTSLL